MNNLEKNKFVYETLYKVFFGSGLDENIDNSLSKIGFLASFAWFAHPGYFVDIRLEQLCATIGNTIWNKTKESNVCTVKSEKRQVLHVASETYDTGGHTRIIFNIIRNDTQSVHSLLLTQQEILNVPEWLKEQIFISGGSITSVAEFSLNKQVELLQKEITIPTLDALFYHIHPDDAVSVSALSANPRPASLVINHADHVFWLGSALADVTVCYRSWALLFSKQYRASQEVALLPTPIGSLSRGEQEVTSEVKLNAKIKLGIPENSILILTVASSGKFIPSGKYNYFKTVGKLLKNNPNVLLKIAGVALSDDLQKLQYEFNEQIELLGVISEPNIYYKAADIYLDSMPFSSFTSLFEAVLFGCYPVLQFSPVDTLTIADEPCFKNIVTHAENEEHQISMLQYAIDNPEFRRTTGLACSQLVRDSYTGIGWLKRLESIYSAASNKVYDLRSLSKLNNQFFIVGNSEEAANLAYYQHGDASVILSRNFHRYIDSISINEILKIYYNLLKSRSKFGKLFSLRQMLYFVKKKVLQY
jgi:glycosyltransferase involved in cell wall biosynthesis